MTDLSVGTTGIIDSKNPMFGKKSGNIPAAPRLPAQPSVLPSFREVNRLLLGIFSSLPSPSLLKPRKDLCAREVLTGHIHVSAVSRLRGSAVHYP